MLSKAAGGNKYIYIYRENIYRPIIIMLCGIIKRRALHFGQRPEACFGVRLIAHHVARKHVSAVTLGGILSIWRAACGVALGFFIIGMRYRGKINLLNERHLQPATAASGRAPSCFLAINSPHKTQHHHLKYTILPSNMHYHFWLHLDINESRRYKLFLK